MVGEVAARVPPRRVTRADVARYAGVSTAVISYVINSGPKAVAPSTRERVLNAIRVLNYRPNAAARTLKLGSSQLLGLVIPDNTNLYFAELTRAIDEAAADKGFSVLESNSAREPELERQIIQNLVSRQVDGLLLVSTEDSPDLSAVIGAGIPVVLLGRRKSVDGVVAVSADHRAGALLAVQHLIDHGHTNIGIVMGADASGTADDREQGWLDALTAAGLPEGPIMRAPFTRVGGYEAGKRLLNRDHRPTAIFAGSDMQAVGLLRALHEADVAVPEDIAVVSYDGSEESQFSWPALTGIHQPVHDVAAAAVDILTDRTAAPEGNYLSFPTELVIRNSCGCPPTYVTSEVS